MIKILIILLLGFFMLSFYNKKTIILVLLFGLLIIFPSSVKADWTQADIDKYLPTYQDAMKRYGVPATFMIRIGIEESELGNSGDIAPAGNNMHGMRYYTGCRIPGFEGWQNYATKEDSIYDLARTLTRFNGKYQTINCLDTSKYPTRDDMIECLLPRMMTYAPPSENNTEKYMEDIRNFMKTHAEYDEGLPTYEEAIRLREDTANLPVIDYSRKDGTCTNKYTPSNEAKFDSNRQDPYSGRIGNNTSYQSIRRYSTSYSGDIKKGYINTSQKGFALTYNEDASDNYIKDKVFNIIDNIFAKTGGYNDSNSRSKPGASAYTANVSYLNGSFKNDIFYYNQADSPHGSKTFYPSCGTIQQCGCGPTSMAIVISSFKGKQVSPLETVNWACSHGHCFSGGSYHSVICALAEEYGLNCSGSLEASVQENQQRVINALATGNSLVVVRVGHGQFCGGSGHFLVLTNVDSNGNIKVADPGSRNKTYNLGSYSFNDFINPAKGHATNFWIISE